MTRLGCRIVFLFWLWVLLCKGTVGSIMTKTITESRLHLKFQIGLIKICISPINIEVCVFLNFFIVAHYNFSLIFHSFLNDTLSLYHWIRSKTHSGMISAFLNIKLIKNKQISNGIFIISTILTMEILFFNN